MTQRILIFTIFTAGYFLSYFFRSANAVIAPSLAADLQLGAGELGFMTSVFFLTFAAVQIPVGISLDRWGPRWVVPTLLLIGTLGSIVFAFAPSFLWVVVGRGLIGIGMAGCLMGSLKAFSRWFPAERFATVSGLLIGIGSTGALFAATPLAWLDTQYGWRSVFIGMGVATFVIAAIILIFGRNMPPGEAWPAPEGSKGGIAQVFRDMRFWRFAILSLLSIGTLQAFLGLWAGPYLFDLYKLPEVAVGNILIWIGIGSTVGYLTSGWLADHFSLPHIVLSGTGFYILVQLFLGAIPPLWMVSIAFFLFGFGGTFGILLMTQVRLMFPDEITGQAISALNLFGFAGTFILQWVMGIVIGSFGANGVGQYPPAAYTTVLLIVAVTNAIGLAFYYPIIRQNATEAKKIPA